MDLFATLRMKSPLHNTQKSTPKQASKKMGLIGLIAEIIVLTALVGAGKYFA
jgi:hypothetical protein